MIRVFDFRCANGHVEEHFVENETAIQCSACPQLAYRQLAAPRAKLDGCSGDFPGAADKWERTRESHMRRERKNMEQHGTYK